ncbi:efflux RND transporter periplasmic adaptor subunit [Steroidobacter sp. S1-65]|uniref:Efflux RND transporter periplasmic adaptor subunit n=1 Tax=Steroidobacter gossypii TaxID=2805490 RepID=A0ABS1X010_9GAMM|nr:efflux RND transporter periplasmic adaptor subunit [Steroidobacter gossypii]MBM0106564.1 efflux RND transporter periplasmic adaptor subunit [Steroidobacter gossypii]
MTKASRAAAIAVVLLAAGYWWHTRAPANVPAPAGGGSTVPVTVVEAQRRDVPQRISAIGTVQSLHTVVLRPQVSGAIVEVSFEEGEMVERGELLARIDDRSIKAALAQAQAEKASGEADLRIAELDLARYNSLRDRSIVSRQTIEQQAAVVEKLKAAIRASEARIEAQRVQLSFSEIRSPMRGRIGIRRIDPGNLVQAGDEQGLVIVTQVDPISIVFTVPQEMLSRLRAATKASRQMQVTAFDRDGGEPLAHGRLTTIDNQVDVATGTLRLRAEFDNDSNELWPGQFVTLQLETGTTANATVLPAQAIQQGMEGPFVYRVHDAVAQPVPVVTSYLDDEIAVIATGVAPGDSIVIDGQSRLKPGTKVKPSTAGGAADVAGT